MMMQTYLLLALRLHKHDIDALAHPTKTAMSVTRGHHTAIATVPRSSFRSGLAGEVLRGATGLLLPCATVTTTWTCTLVQQMKLPERTAEVLEPSKSAFPAKRRTKSSSLKKLCSQRTTDWRMQMPHRHIYRVDLLFLFMITITTSLSLEARGWRIG